MDPKFTKFPYQDSAELDVFVNLVKEENVRSYLEIGSKYGGSFWRVVCAMPVGSVAVAVDLPGTTKLRKYPFSQPYLLQCVKDLRAKGYDAHCIIGDSTDKKVIREAQQRAPYDLCLIDGNHTVPYIRADWDNYGPMAKIVAFHDIGWEMDPRKQKQIEVPLVWNEIKTEYRYQEIKLCSVNENGLGVLWRHEPRSSVQQIAGATSG